ncbi:hypothetical protein WJX72_012176 [[Myrmecia] bisecta]|uniref:BTB domain-containing protein n=1 Tax=[Myrmecia] bisecta TaxID=41462 RepID=A0AAW1RAD1_9CHLO
MASRPGASWECNCKSCTALRLQTGALGASLLDSLVNKRLVDVVQRVGPSNLDAHRLVLQSASTRLRDYWHVYTTAGAPAVLTIDERETHATTMRQLIFCMYGGNLYCEQAFQAGPSYSAPRLGSAPPDFLVQDEVIRFYEKARDYGTADFC